MFSNIDWTLFFRTFFPACMVFGALGSLITNLLTKDKNTSNLIWIAMSVQWLGATLLYTGLLLRNRG